MSNKNMEGMQMKKRLAAWLAGLMVLSIAGCSSGGTAETTAAQTEAAGAEESVRRNGLDQSGISDVEWQEQPITVVPNDYQE